MTIQRYKPNGYFVTQDQNGNLVEGETRQCVHCQFIWQYEPGSGHTRGFCLKCNGLTCARPECLKIGCNGSYEKEWELLALTAERENRLRAQGAVLL